MNKRALNANARMSLPNTTKIKRMPLVVIESPYAGDVTANLDFLHACMLDCLRRGEAPFASHMMYTKILDDDKPAERALGIAAGLAWGSRADYVVVYTDRGISEGMRQGIELARLEKRLVKYRQLQPNNPKHYSEGDDE